MILMIEVLLFICRILLNHLKLEHWEESDLGSYMEALASYQEKLKQKEGDL